MKIFLVVHYIAPPLEGIYVCNIFVKQWINSITDLLYFKSQKVSIHPWSIKLKTWKRFLILNLILVILDEIPLLFGDLGVCINLDSSTMISSLILKRFDNISRTMHSEWYWFHSHFKRHRSNLLLLKRRYNISRNCPFGLPENVYSLLAIEDNISMILKYN